MQKIFAQSLTVGDGITLEGFSGFKFNSIADVVNSAMPYVFAFAGMGFLITIILAGFIMLTSVGDAKKLEGAKQKLTNGILGLALIIAAYWIVQIAKNVLGIERGFGGF